MSEAIWRVGRHYGIHVYASDKPYEDRPVATFLREEDAQRAVLAVNRGLLPEDAEFVLVPPRGWLNRIDEELMKCGVESWMVQHLSRELGDLIRGWALGLDNDR